MINKEIYPTKDVRRFEECINEICLHIYSDRKSTESKILSIVPIIFLDKVALGFINQ